MCDFGLAAILHITSEGKTHISYPWEAIGSAAAVRLRAWPTTTVTTVLVLWAGTSPGYDPYGWLMWGHQTPAWNLNTSAAPSSKPLPYLFTVP